MALSHTAAALGQFLRAQRERLRPDSLGLPSGARRRTPGLRRKEVAQRAGLSLAWYTWIEQGRDVAVSADSLARIAEALALSRAERAYLFELAAQRDPAESERAGPVPDALADSVAALSVPAYLLDRDWNALAYNAAAAELFVGWLPDEPNLLRYMFSQPAARELVVDWDERARRLVAEFRADNGSRLDTPAMRALVEDLAHRSPAFAALWRAQQVDAREGGPRAFRHPRRGLLHYEQVTWHAAADRGLKLVMLLGPR